MNILRILLCLLIMISLPPAMNISFATDVVDQKIEGTETDSEESAGESGTSSNRGLKESMKKDALKAGEEAKEVPDHLKEDSAELKESGKTIKESTKESAKEVGRSAKDAWRKFKGAFTGGSGENK